MPNLAFFSMSAAKRGVSLNKITTNCFDTYRNSLTTRQTALHHTVVSGRTCSVFLIRKAKKPFCQINRFQWDIEYSVIVPCPIVTICWDVISLFLPYYRFLSPGYFQRIPINQPLVSIAGIAHHQRADYSHVFPDVQQPVHFRITGKTTYLQ